MHEVKKYMLGENTLKVNHFSPNKMMYNKYCDTQ
jgi:hypothetical protein